MNELKDWKQLNDLANQLNTLVHNVGFLRQHMPGEANVCVSNAYLKLREAQYWLDDAIGEENIQ